MHFVTVKSILSAKNGMNLYRGCSHGCIYCDSRSSCYRGGYDFEDIEIKANAIELLENALRWKRAKCMLGTGAMTDPYIPLESKVGNVRKDRTKREHDQGTGRSSEKIGTSRYPDGRLALSHPSFHQ